MNKKDSSRSFHYKDISIETHPEVYDPAEDTFLLLDAIDVKKDDSVLEIGTGCGIIALNCARIGANIICTDINPIAVELVKKNYLMNQNKLTGDFEVRIGGLFSPILSNETFDVIIFNPPYLPTTKDGLIKEARWFDIAINGGRSGLEIIKKFIQSLPLFLKNDGTAYFVFSSLADKNKLESIIRKNKFDAGIILSQNFYDETLSIYSLTKK